MIDRRFRSGVLAALCCAGWPAALPAQLQPDTASRLPAAVLVDKAPYLLVYDHVSGEARLYDERRKLADAWTAEPGRGRAPVAPIPPERPLTVEVRNANPLLYDYDVTASTVRQRPLRSCRALGSRFAQRGFLVSVGAIGSTFAGGLGMDTLFSGSLSSERLSQAFLGGESKAAVRSWEELTPSSVETRLARIRTSVDAYVEFAGWISTLSSTLDASVALAAELGESVATDSLLGDLQRSVQRRAPELRRSADVPRVAHERLDRARPAIAELVTLVAALEEPDVRDQPGMPALAAEAAGMRREVDAALADYVESYRTLQGELHEIELARARTTQRFTLAASGDVRRVAVQIRPTEKYQEVPRVRAGEVELYTEPFLSLMCRISVGFALTEPPARYEVNGGVVEREGGQDHRAAPSLLLHVSTPRIPLGALLGVGIGTNGRPDLYLGTSLFTFEPLAINIGAVWQRQPLLPAGLAVGDRTSDPDVLDRLDFEYRPFLFFGMSIAP